MYSGVWVIILARRGLFRERVAIYVARIASGIVPPHEFENRVLARHIIEAVRNVGIQLRDEKRGALWCPICNKGPFTKRGYYLHLTRTHYSHLIALVDLESKRILDASKSLA